VEGANVLAYMEAAARVAAATGDWVIVVVPNREVLEEALPLFTGMAPYAEAFSGRTMRFSNGGKVSLAEAGVMVFTPETFDVLFAGWIADVDVEEMYKWRTEARKVLRLQAA
jgi:hypothetical protein